jgi:uncharacterized membrane protein YfcA
MLTVLLGGLVIFVTHALEAITGFGCTVLALPFITALFGFKSGVMTLTILAWILALYIVITKRKNIDFKQFGIIVTFVLLGLPIGIYLFRNVNSAFLKKVLAVFIIIASAIQLYAFFFPARANKKLPRWAAFFLLFLGGIVHGMFASGGPLVVLYAAEALPDKGKFRATLCLLWTTLNTILIGTYIFSGTITTATMGRTASMLPFLGLGILAGELIHHRVEPRIFKLIVFTMLFATGVIMLFL